MACVAVSRACASGRRQDSIKTASRRRQDGARTASGRHQDGVVLPTSLCCKAATCQATPSWPPLALAPEVAERHRAIHVLWDSARCDTASSLPIRTWRTLCTYSSPSHQYMSTSFYYEYDYVVTIQICDYNAITIERVRQARPHEPLGKVRGTSHWW